MRNREISAAERQRLARRRKKRKKRWIRQMLFRLVMLMGIGGIVAYAGIQLKDRYEDAHRPVMANERTIEKVVENPPDYQVELLTVNDYSRPAIPLEKVNGIVVHYTANPGTTAEQNRNYFEGLKDGYSTSASSHFIIGLDGEIVQCIPCNEIAYASNERNEDTIAIECCIPDETGAFNEATYSTLVHLVAWLCGRYDLQLADVIRHYDITGKSCPKYFVEHEDAWEQFKMDVWDYIDQNGIAN